MEHTMGQGKPPRQGQALTKKPLSPARRALPWLTIVKHLGLSLARASLNHRCTMRFPQAVFASALLISASAAAAETRVFIVANHPDTYGIDQCLAKGEKCGAHAARAYCQSRDFAQASSFRRVEPDEITGFVPKGGARCPHGGCDYVAITCQR